MKKITLLLAFLMTLWLPAFNGYAMSMEGCNADNTLRIDDDVTQVMPGRFTEYVIDSQKNVTATDVLGRSSELTFVSEKKDSYGFGFSKSAYWLRFCVENAATEPSEWILDVAYPVLTRADLHIRRTGAADAEQRSGASVPFSRRPLDYRNIGYRIPLHEPGMLVLALRVESGGSITIPFSLSRSDVFSKNAVKSDTGFGVYFGIMLAMVAYNLFLYVTIRDTNYLFYVLFICSFALFLSTLNGFTSAVFFTERAEGVVSLVPIGIGSVIVFSTIFMRKFLGADGLPRWVLTGSRIMTALGALGVLVSITLPYAIAIRFCTAITPLNAIIIMVASVISVRRGYEPARYFLAAWTALLLAVTMYPLRAAGLLPANAITANGMQFGSAIEVILLSLALAARIRTMKTEKEAAQAEALRNQTLALEQREKMDRLKDEFLANTSHELRTPLNGIIGLAEASLAYHAADIPGNLRNNLNMIVISGRRLGSLVNDILDFSKLRHEEIALSCRALNLSAMSELVIALSRPLIQQREIVLEHDVPETLPPVWADENRVQQILHNLVGNALKFTRSGRVTLSASVDGNMLIVAVRDTGIGIPADRLSSIFESFNQGDGGIAREFGGTGLGLSITKKLVELHGGVLKVESAIGEGSCFSFGLPLASGQQLELVSDQPVFGKTLVSAPSVVMVQDVPDVSGNHRVLIVDDEPINRQVLRAQLASAGYAVVEAPDGPSALEILADPDAVFDMVLLDVMMPRLSGFDTCVQIRKNRFALQMPIIFLTAKSQIDDVLAGFDAGGNDYLVKPFSRDELLARMKIHLELVTTHRIISEYSKTLEKHVATRTRELVDTQQQLVLKQKMAALGVLTAGIAHEINNPNNFVQVALQNVSAWKKDFDEFFHDLLDEDTDPEIRGAFRAQFDKLDRQLELIETGSKRIDSIVRGLRVVTRLDEAERQDADVLEGLQNTIQLLQPTVAGIATFSSDSTSGLRIACWPAELNQVFMNLLMNAVHAIEDRAKSNQFELPGVVHISTALGRDVLEIIIRDNGCGMDEATRLKACDPFFTTRVVGSGAGLGLSISMDIIRKHDGELLLESTLNKGTTVRVRLPLNGQKKLAS